MARKTRDATTSTPTTREARPLSDAALRRKQAECLHTVKRTTKSGATNEYIAYVAWGSDNRYRRCRLCGHVQAFGLSTRATTPSRPRRATKAAKLEQLALW